MIFFLLFIKISHILLESLNSSEFEVRYSKKRTFIQNEKENSIKNLKITKFQNLDIFCHITNKPGFLTSISFSSSWMFSISLNMFIVFLKPDKRIFLPSSLSNSSRHFLMIVSSLQFNNDFLEKTC